MSNLRVLIVGASIAGPMTAYWLARAGCTDITIIERFPSLRSGGQSVDIRTVGVTVMRKVPGMQEAVEAVRPPIDAFTWVDEKGKPYAQMKASGDPDAQTLISEFEIYRGDLSKIVCDYLKPYEKDGKVKFIFNEQVASITQPDSNGPVTVDFLNGTPAAEYDLVVAADGSTSRTRALAFSCGVRDHLRSMNLWIAWFTAPHDMLPPGDSGAAYNAPPGRFFGLEPGSGGGSKGVMMTAPPGDGVDTTLPFRAAQKEGEEALKRYVGGVYRDAGWRAPELVQGMFDSKDFYASEAVQVHAPALSNLSTRTVLVGDAGYASGFGTGTSLALCGAYVLAGSLLTHPNDLVAGLEAYETRMRPIVKDLQKQPPGIRSFLAPQTAWGLKVRNVFLRAVCWAMGYGRYFSWVGGWLGSAAFRGDKYGLPEYEWVA